MGAELLLGICSCCCKPVKTQLKANKTQLLWVPLASVQLAGEEADAEKWGKNMCWQPCLRVVSRVALAAYSTSSRQRWVEDLSRQMARGHVITFLFPVQASCIYQHIPPWRKRSHHRNKPITSSIVSLGPHSVWDPDQCPFGKAGPWNNNRNEEESLPQWRLWLRRWMAKSCSSQRCWKIVALFCSHSCHLYNSVTILPSVAPWIGTAFLSATWKAFSLWKHQWECVAVLSAV